MCTAVCRPRTSIPPASPAGPNVSAPCVPLTVTVSAEPSPLPPAPARSASIAVRSVPDRSPTTTLSAPPRARNATASTSSRSIVTLATSRKRRTRPPLALMSTFSETLAPLNRSVSRPSWPSTVSLPSPGSHWKASSPAPISARSLPLSPKTESLPSPPIIVSAPCEPRRVSLPAPASRVSWITSAGSAVAVTVSLPPSAWTTRRSLAPSALVMFTIAASPAIDADVPLPVTLIVSAPLRRRPSRCRPAVAGVAAQGGGEIGVELGSRRCRRGRRPPASPTRPVRRRRRPRRRRCPSRCWRRRG